MRKFLAGMTFVALGLAGCADPASRAIVDACVDQGGAKTECQCFADLAEEKLAPETYQTLADISRDPEEASREFLTSMSIDEAGQLGLLAVEASRTCEISGLDWLLP